jgi:putative membrane protein insertion efficiency factor
MKWLSLRLVRLYQVALSPLLGASCRHQPTCSTYTYQAIERFGPIRGTWLGIRRIVRCRPGSAGGFDPVPQQAPTETSPHKPDQRHTE